jgi:hypothetical protein
MNFVFLEQMKENERKKQQSAAEEQRLLLSVNATDNEK